MSSEQTCTHALDLFMSIADERPGLSVTVSPSAEWFVRADIVLDEVTMSFLLLFDWPWTFEGGHPAMVVAGCAAGDLAAAVRRSEAVLCDEHGSHVWLPVDRLSPCDPAHTTLFVEHEYWDMDRDGPQLGALTGQRLTRFITRCESGADRIHLDGPLRASRALSAVLARNPFAHDTFVAIGAAAETGKVVLLGHNVGLMDGPPTRPRSEVYVPWVVDDEEPPT